MPGRPDDDQPVVRVRRVGQVGASASHRRAPGSRRLRSPRRHPSRENDENIIIAADRIVPIGLARSWPGDVGGRPMDRLVEAEGPAVLASRGRPATPMAACPRLPARTAASSERMSPNRFSVTITSKSAGRLISSIAHESTSWWLTSTSGMRRRSSSTTRRQRRDVASTFALSTLVRRRRRVNANAPASRTIRRISSSEYGIVSTARRWPFSLAGLLALPEVHAAGQLADDQQVDALEQLGPERRRRDKGRVDLDRPQVGEQPEPAAQREERLLRSDGRGRIGPFRAADRTQQDRVGTTGRSRRLPGGSRRHRHRSPRRRRRSPSSRRRNRSDSRPRPARAVRRRPPPARHRRPGWPRPDTLRGCPPSRQALLGPLVRERHRHAVDLGPVELVGRHEIGVQRRLDDVRA